VLIFGKQMRKLNIVLINVTHVLCLLCS